MNQAKDHSAPQRQQVCAASRQMGQLMCRAALVTGLAIGLAQQARAQSDGVTMTPTGDSVAKADAGSKLVDQAGAVMRDIVTSVQSASEAVRVQANKLGGWRGGSAAALLNCAGHSDLAVFRNARRTLQEGEATCLQPTPAT